MYLEDNSNDGDLDCSEAFFFSSVHSKAQTMVAQIPYSFFSFMPPLFAIGCGNNGNTAMCFYASTRIFDPKKKKCPIFTVRFFFCILSYFSGVVMHKKTDESNFISGCYFQNVLYIYASLFFYFFILLLQPMAPSCRARSLQGECHQPGQKCSWILLLFIDAITTKSVSRLSKAEKSLFYRIDVFFLLLLLWWRTRSNRCCVFDSQCRFEIPGFESQFELWVAFLSCFFCNAHTHMHTHTKKMKASSAKKQCKNQNNHKKEPSGTPLITLPNRAAWLMCTGRGSCAARTDPHVRQQSTCKDRRAAGVLVISSFMVCRPAVQVQQQLNARFSDVFVEQKSA